MRVIDGSRLVFIVPGRFFWFQVGFSWFHVGLFFFKVPGLFFMFFMVPGLVFYDSLMVPGWFKSQLRAGGAK